MAGDAASLRDAALAELDRGNSDESERLFDAAITAAGGDARMLNSAANAALRSDRVDRAITLFRRAHEADPASAEFAVNLAIALARSGDDRGALDLLTGNEGRAGAEPRYWSTRAVQERACGLIDEAARSYDRCLAIEPGHPRALHGRARIALERGEADATPRYVRATEAAPGDAMAWLGRAQALDAAGDSGGAQEVARVLVAQLPGWTEALALLAQLRRDAGDDDFAGHFADAHVADPTNRAIVEAWCAALAGGDCFVSAADAAARGRRAMPNDPVLAMLEAAHAGEAGDDSRAARIFGEFESGTFESDDPDLLVERARHALRLRLPEQAEMLAARAIAAIPGHIVAWALRGIAWRLTGDARHEWLHGQDGMVRSMAIDLDPGDLAEIAGVLDRLHDGAPQMLGQSVRGGTQTRGALFARMEPELHLVHAALMRGLERYRQGLPPADAAHPLLAHRDAPWRITGSWSVRLGGAGMHTTHIHPRGIVSSALYLCVPPADPADDRAGWLQLGAPPPGLRLDLDPQFEIEPRAGYFALFPSTLYHGVRPFGAGKRMSIAFDVTRTDAP